MTREAPISERRHPTPPVGDRDGGRYVAGHGFQVQRVYESVRDVAGYRVLVDRLWPRGLKRTEAALDDWAKDVAPSTELRKWYGHEPAKFRGFADRYRNELAQPAATQEISRLLSLACHQHVLLLTATRDVGRSGAQVLRDHLEDLLR